MCSPPSGHDQLFFYRGSLLHALCRASLCSLKVLACVEVSLSSPSMSLNDSAPTLTLQHFKGRPKGGWVNMDMRRRPCNKRGGWEGRGNQWLLWSQQEKVHCHSWRGHGVKLDYKFTFCKLVSVIFVSLEFFFLQLATWPVLKCVLVTDEDVVKQVTDKDVVKEVLAKCSNHSWRVQWYYAFAVCWKTAAGKPEVIVWTASCQQLSQNCFCSQSSLSTRD